MERTLPIEPCPSGTTLEKTPLAELEEGDVIIISNGKMTYKETEGPVIFNELATMDIADAATDSIRNGDEELTDEDLWFNALPTNHSATNTFDSRPLLFLTVQLKGTKHLAMVDTGASTSYLDA